ncbi:MULTISPECIES: GNAT family N-acetyltransferase [Cryobacterium]|uniref:GNAT family N-acetyltransferase n=1 Tax=Cryobacterium TaxID=69578 RepID=UPI0035149734
MSTLWAVADGGKQTLIAGAHHAAIQDVFALLERDVAMTRVGAAGTRGAIVQGEIRGVIAAGACQVPTAERAQPKFDDSECWIVAEDTATGIVGFGLATKPGSGLVRDPPAAPVIGLLAVAPDAQGRGLGANFHGSHHRASPTWLRPIRTARTRRSPDGGAPLRENGMETAG